LAILQERAALVMDDFFEFIIGEPASELDAAPYGGGRFPVETASTGEHSRSFTLISVPGICSVSRRNSCAHEIARFRRNSHGGLPIHLPRGTLCAKTPCLHVVKKAAELAC
jgi:hypothetical protein